MPSTDPDLVLDCDCHGQGVEVKVMIWWQGVDVGAVTNFDRETYA